MALTAYAVRLSATIIQNTGGVEQMRVKDVLRVSLTVTFLLAKHYCFII